MIASRVVSEDDVHKRLAASGFEATGNRVATGEYWRSKSTGKHLLVPDSVQGFYPDWLLKDLEARIGKISPGPLPTALH